MSITVTTDKKAKDSRNPISQAITGVWGIIHRGWTFFVQCSDGMKVAIVTGALGIPTTAVAVISSILPMLEDKTPTPPPPQPPPPARIRSSRERYDIKVLKFVDRAYASSPPEIGPTGQPGTSMYAMRPIFDESIFLSSMELDPHTAEYCEMILHTSGIGQGEAVFPSEGESEEYREAYERSTGTTLVKRFALKDGRGGYLRHVTTFGRACNGLQRRADQTGYESDFGHHIRYETELVEFVVDFSAIDFGTLIVGEPKVTLKHPNGHRTRVESSFENGVVKSTALNPPVGSTLIVDWTWATEKTATNTHAAAVTK